MGKFVTFGEIMLRLKSPGHEKLFQSPVLEASFGGAEANVAVSLANFGLDSVFVTALPVFPPADRAISVLRGFGVDVSFVKRTPGRMGVYYLESGAAQRPSVVFYDRDASSFSSVTPGLFDWGEIFSGAEWFHVSGVSPAVSESAALTCIEAVEAAGKAGAVVSIDLNFRKKLWKYGKKASEIMDVLVSRADILIANEEDIQLSLGIYPGASSASCDGSGEAGKFRKLCAAVREKYRNISAVAVTDRISHSADWNGWEAFLLNDEGFFCSGRYEINDIVDRMGTGDAFAAGFIFGLKEFADGKKALEFAAAASCLKHSYPGDFNLSSKPDVEDLIASGGSGRVKR